MGRLLITPAGSIQAGASEWTPGRTVIWLWPSLGRRQQEEQNGDFPKPGRGPARIRGTLNLVPGGRRLCLLSQSTSEAQQPSEMSTKTNRPSQDSSAPSPDFKELAPRREG